MSSKSVPQECLTRVSSKKCQVRRVKQEVSSKSVLQECQVRVSSKKCLTRVSGKSVLEECQARVSSERQARVSYQSVAQ